MTAPSSTLLTGARLFLSGPPALHRLRPVLALFDTCVALQAAYGRKQAFIELSAKARRDIGLDDATWSAAKRRPFWRF